jgi:Fe-S-cluster containining protein
MSVRYECDQCGACCRGHLIVEADLLDFLREPRLAEADPSYARLSAAEVRTQLEDDSRCLVISCGKPCKLLGDDQRCKIYATRPNGCVAMEAGDEQCQHARSAAGLPPLEPLAVHRDGAPGV